MDREGGNRQRMRKSWEWISLSISSLSLHFLSISSFSLHFLFIFSFSLHFLATRLPGCHNLCNPVHTQDDKFVIYCTILEIFPEISEIKTWKPKRLKSGIFLHAMKLAQFVEARANSPLGSRSRFLQTKAFLYLPALFQTISIQLARGFYSILYFILYCTSATCLYLPCSTFK